MKIAILGAGKVGRALGLKWAERGHEITFGVRDSKSPELRAWSESQAGNSFKSHPRDHCYSSKQIARAVPGSRVVKIFNTVGYEVLGDPDFDGTAATMFFCCNEEVERNVAQQLAADAGFDPVMIGGLASSPILEELTLLRGMLAYGQRMGRNIALKLMARL
jgi:predicted dinucleotide-binding enzyme